MSEDMFFSRCKKGAEEGLDLVEEELAIEAILVEFVGLTVGGGDDRHPLFQ